MLTTSWSNTPVPKPCDRSSCETLTEKCQPKKLVCKLLAILKTANLGDTNQKHIVNVVNNLFFCSVFRMQCIKKNEIFYSLSSFFYRSVWFIGHPSILSGLKPITVLAFTLMSLLSCGISSGGSRCLWATWFTSC